MEALLLTLPNVSTVSASLKQFPEDLGSNQIIANFIEQFTKIMKNMPEMACF